MHLAPKRKYYATVGTVVTFIGIAVLWLALYQYKFFEISESVRINPAKSRLPQKFLDIIGWSRNEVSAHLSNAEEKLRLATDVIERKASERLLLIREYTKEIRLARESWDKIGETDERMFILAETFHRLARQQQILRAIRRRDPYTPLSAIDVARYENMALLERVVGSMGSGADQYTKTEADSAISNTRRILSCPDCNVVLILLTTLRKDHVGLYGYQKQTTPHVDNFFENSLRFTNTFAPSSWTIPDAISLFTSLFPYSHGVLVRELPSNPLIYNKKILTLAQVLSGHNYLTAAFTGGGDYNTKLSGLDRGFDLYLDETTYPDVNKLSLGGASPFYAPLRSFIELSSKWLANNFEKKFFLVLQGYDTHCPYTPHEPFASRFTGGLRSTLDYTACYTTYEDTEPTLSGGEKYWVVQGPYREGNEKRDTLLSEKDLQFMIGLYDARVAEADYYLGRFLQKARELGLEKNTIFILMSEHGEMLGEKGRFMRGGSTHGTAYEPTLNFPLLIKHPKISRAIVIDDLTQTVDIMPTILTMLSIKDPQEHIREGKSLSFSIFGDKPTNDSAYAASVFFPSVSSYLFKKPTAVEAVRNKEWKLIKNTIFTETGLREDAVSYELYNIRDDPREEKNLYESNSRTADGLKNELESWLHQYINRSVSL